MKIGATDIVNCKIGSTQVNEIRIGSTLVWQFSSVDPDAQAFITAAGITNPTQQTAINTLVVSLKANGIWTKMKAIYPFVGGTAFSHKFNLKNPLDTDAAFRLVFNGGWTHSANGVLPNGTNAYADTKVSPLDNLSLYNTHLSIYSRTNIFGNFVDMGIENGASSRLILYSKFNSSSGFYDCYDANTGRLTFNMTGITTQGLILANRRSNSLSNAWKNNTKLTTNNNTITTTPSNLKLFLGALNISYPLVYSPRQYAFSSIGDGLTDTEASNLYTAVQAFNTTLGRQV